MDTNPTPAAPTNSAGTVSGHCKPSRSTETVFIDYTRLPALLAAVDKALAAWDEFRASPKTIAAMSELRALQQEMK